MDNNQARRSRQPQGSQQDIQGHASPPPARNQPLPQAAKHGVKQKSKSNQPMHEPAPMVNREQKRIVQWLKKVKFKKKLFGGVNERDVWKKIGELDSMYNEVIYAERVRYNTLLDQLRRANLANANIEHYEQHTGGEGE